jgi:hypothetical protein
VTLKFDHVFPGEGCRSLEPEHHTLIKNILIDVLKMPVVGLSRRWQSAHYLLGYGQSSSS